MRYIVDADGQDYRIRAQIIIFVFKSRQDTAHFVTSDLDEGPIIEQNVVRVDHSRSPAALVAIGQDEESRTLTQAVKWFAERRVLLDQKRTIILR